MEYRYTAIVLGKKDVGETDRLYTFMTKESGKVVVKGVGVRKPNAKLSGHLETGSFVSLSVMKSRGMGRISSAVAEFSCIHIESSLKCFQEVFWAFSLFNRLVEEGERDEHLFSLLVSFCQQMRILDEAGKRARMGIISSGFIYQSLMLLGFALELHQCVHCEGKLRHSSILFLSTQHGGVLCETCRSSWKYGSVISRESITLLRIFKDNSLHSLTKLSVKDTCLAEIKNILELLVVRATQ